MNWDQVAVEVGYKDRVNAKAMGSRLVKKLADASAGSAAAGDGDNNDAGEGTSKAAATPADKKRKATGIAGGDASPVKGEFSMTDGFRILMAPNLLCSRSYEEAKGYAGPAEYRGQGRCA